MSFPPHIERVFEIFGVPPDTKNAIYELYVAMGEEALEVFGEIAESVDSPSNLRPEHCAEVRSRVVERYLTRNHPLWCEGHPTASLYRPRVLEGRASGLAIPLGPVTPNGVADDQPVPEGILMQSRNAHFGGREGTISFDLIPPDLADAIAIGQALGQQHTLPGSVGETTGTLDGERSLALIWEIQPNVYKPAGDRNRNIARLYRRHRNWHIITLVAALEWLRSKRFRVYILRGEALAATHEVNPSKPVSQTIIDLHNRTVANVTSGLEIALKPATRDDEQLLLDSTLMNTGLLEHVTFHGAAGAIWRTE
ncbi:MAG TPA: hypothetical protein VL284_14430 [Thermoanaerobaculia bacterium]|nr:hypothetical protein [Thermoanaerobaculia bacterium]